MLNEEFVIIKSSDDYQCYNLKLLEWLVPIGDEIRHVRAELVNDGGMVQFYWAGTDEIAGCMGISAFKDAIQEEEIGLVEYEQYD